MEVAIMHPKESTAETAEGCCCWQKRARASSKGSTCAAWNDIEHPEKGSGSLTLTAVSSLSEWRRTMLGQRFFRELVWGRDLQWGFEGSFGLNVLGQPVGTHITFVIISAIYHTAPLEAPGTERSSTNPVSLWPNPLSLLFSQLVGMHGWYPLLEEETGVIGRSNLQSICCA